MEAKESLCTILEAVLAIKKSHPVNYIYQFLKGEETEEIVENGHDQLELFGSGESESIDFWKELVNEAVKQNYFEIVEENLLITKDGKKFLKKPKSFKVRGDDDDDYDEPEEDGPQVEDENCVADIELFTQLKKLRKRLAEDKGVGLNTIFKDNILEAMATSYPITVKELMDIQGISQDKVKKYGKEFCELIHSHCVANEIERPEDVHRRTSAKKSGLKVAIIQGIDRQIALDEIALSKGIEYDDLLEELASLIKSGVKLKIDYFIEDVMDLDRVDEIMEYFETTKDSNLEHAREKLGSDYDDDEITLVRLKFMSEQI